MLLSKAEASGGGSTGMCLSLFLALPYSKNRLCGKRVTGLRDLFSFYQDANGNVMGELCNIPAPFIG